MSRRLAKVGALTVALLAQLLTAAAAGAAGAEVSAVGLTGPTMNPGQTAWVSVVWTTKDTVSDFAVVAAPPAGVTVGYPAGKASSSPYGSASLVKKTQDFTALKVTVPYTASGSVDIPLTASWTAKGGAETLAATLTIPLVAYSGPDLTQVTTAVTIDRSGPAWVDIAFRGEAPSLDDFRVTVAGPDELEIVYPGDGTSSGLNGVSTLFAGIEDHTAFRLDASRMAPGTYTLQLTETFTRPGAATSTGTVELVVT